MIKLDNITLAFGSRTLIAGGTAHFECGTMTALLGRNGTGKSTLLRAMASLGTVQSGHIEIGGKALHDLSNVELARQLAFVNTERVAVEAMTGYDLVAVGRSPYTDWSGRLKSHDHAMVERAMAIAGVEHLATRYVDTLSDGECQRVMIARALAQQTPVIVLDEPTAFLDIPTRFEICRLLAELAHNSGKTIIFSTHDIDAAMPVSDAFAILDNAAITMCNQQSAKEQIKRLFSL